MASAYWSCLCVAVLWGFLNSGFCDAHGETACSKTNLVESAEKFQMCLDETAEVLQDNARFYFGTDYQEICRTADPFSFECVIPEPVKARNYSITDVLFQRDISQGLTSFIEVSFQVNKGDSYEGCDTTVTMTEDMDIFIDPVSYHVHDPFHLKSHPSLTLHVPPGEVIDTETMYTVIIQALASYVFHMMYTNVKLSADGQAIDSTTIFAYNGPINFRPIVQPYAVMVFRQDSVITLSDEWTDRILNSGINVAPSTLNEFLIEYSLSDPIAVNLLMVWYDIYSVQQIKLATYNSIENCAAFVDKALESHPRPWLPQILPEEESLSVVIQTIVDSPEFMFTFCCEDYYYGAKSFMLDPIGDQIYSTVETRSEVDLEFRVTKNKPYIPFNGPDFEDKMFTMLSVDPDIPAAGAGVGNNEKPLAHMLLMNGKVREDQLGQLEFESELIGWNGPGAPDIPPVPHTYYFLLFEQTSGELIVDIEELIRNNITVDCNIRGRCLYDIPAFASKYDLTLVGATWFRAQNDPYVNYRRNVVSVCENNNVCGPTTDISSAAADLLVQPGIFLMINIVVALAINLKM